ncbi:MAG: efflux RND transporter permease subunit [Nitrospira sp.]
MDREASARYGLRVSDVNAVVQAAVGGQAVTQVFEGERLFDLVVRFLPIFGGMTGHRAIFWSIRRMARGFP